MGTPTFDEFQWLMRSLPIFWSKSPFSMKKIMIFQWEHHNTFDEGMSCHSTRIELFYFDDNFRRIAQWVPPLTCEFHLRYMKIEYAFIVARDPNIMPCRFVMIYKVNTKFDFNTMTTTINCICIMRCVYPSKVEL